LSIFNILAEYLTARSLNPDLAAYYGSAYKYNTSGNIFTLVDFKPSTIKGANSGADGRGIVFGTDAQFYKGTLLNSAAHAQSIKASQKRDVIDALMVSENMGIAIFAVNPGDQQGGLFFTINGGASWDVVPNQTGNYKKLAWYETNLQNTHKILALTNGQGFSRVLCAEGNNTVNITSEFTGYSGSTALWACADGQASAAMVAYNSSLLHTFNLEDGNTDWTYSSISNVVQICGKYDGTGVGVLALISGGTLKQIQINANGILTQTALSLTGVRSMCENRQTESVYVIDGAFIYRYDTDDLISTTNPSPVSTSYSAAGTILTSYVSQNHLIIIRLNSSIIEVDRVPLVPVLGTVGAPVINIPNYFLPQPLTDIHSSSGTTLISAEDGDIMRIDNGILQRYDTYTTPDWNAIAVRNDNTNESVIVVGDEGKVALLHTPNNTNHIYEANLITVGTQDLLAIGYDDAGTTALNDDFYYATGKNGVAYYDATMSVLGQPTLVPQPAQSGQPDLHAVLLRNSSPQAITRGENGRTHFMSGTTRNNLDQWYSLPLHAVHFKDVNNGTVVGSNGTVRYTSTGGDDWGIGQNWNLANAEYNTLYGVVTTGPGSAYAVGDSHMVLKLESGICSDEIAGAPSASTNVLRDICYIGYSGKVDHLIPPQIDQLKLAV
jgi:hypothetical protein